MQHDLRLRAAARAIYDACYPSEHWAPCSFDEAERYGMLSNALESGWVPTRMGGAGATDDLSQGHITQSWLAISDDPEATVTGCYFYHQRPAKLLPAASSRDLQDRLLGYCRDVSGVGLG